MRCSAAVIVALGFVWIAADLGCARRDPSPVAPSAKRPRIGKAPLPVPKPVPKADEDKKADEENGDLAEPGLGMVLITGGSTLSIGLGTMEGAMPITGEMPGGPIYSKATRGFGMGGGMMGGFGMGGSMPGGGFGMGGGMMGMGGGMGMGMMPGSKMSGGFFGKTMMSGRLAIGGSALPGLDTLSGLLTAGSFNDNLDPRHFLTFAAKMKANKDLGDLPGKMGGRLVVIVEDQKGNPVGNARVRLEGKGNTAELITRSDGQAIFMRSWDGLPAGQDLTATIFPPYGAPPLTEIIPAGKSTCPIVLPRTEGHLPRSLDLAIVLDTTGSMGDELVYLKGEIRGIVNSLRKKFPGVLQRFALVLYRDDGDEYVARRFDFTTSLEEFHGRLAKQSADGGGDYPEAVHRGFEEAQKLSWQESDTARVVLWLADAPPHAQFMARTMAAANALRKKGIVFYPVACSGYDDSTEFIMRSCAMLTGGQFLFLTDDSGVGDAHAEPSIPHYQVERLEKLIVRMVACELAGRRLDPLASDVLRTVGKKAP